MEAGDAEHGVMDTVTLETAVAEYLPDLHAGKDVPDAGSGLFVGLVARLLPGGQVLAGPVTVWSRAGTRVATTMSTASPRNLLRGRSAITGPSRPMTRSAADFEMPKSGADRRSVKFAHQYVSTLRPVASGIPAAAPRAPPRTLPAPPRRRAVSNSPKPRGLSPVNGAVQDGSDAVITPATSRRSHPCTAARRPLRPGRSPLPPRWATMRRRTLTVVTKPAVAMPSYVC